MARFNAVKRPDTLILQKQLVATSVPDSSTYGVYPRESGENWVVKMMDLPYHQYSDTRFTINEKGS